MSEEILDALRNIRSGERYDEYGLCAALEGRLRGGRTFLKEAKRTQWFGWEHYSGVLEYPVPGVDGLSPEGAYHSDTPMWSGEYGALRLNLVDHLISVVEAWGMYPPSNTMETPTVEWYGRLTNEP